MTNHELNFALSLRCVRRRLGLSQNELADLLDVAQNTISRWEDRSRAPRDPLKVLTRLDELDEIYKEIVDDIIELAIRDGDTVTVVTYEVDEHWWLADERARDLVLPASMHQTAAAQAASEIKDSDIDDQTFVTIRASH